MVWFHELMEVGYKPMRSEVANGHESHNKSRAFMSLPIKT